MQTDKFIFDRTSYSGMILPALRRRLISASIVVLTLAVSLFGQTSAPKNSGASSTAAKIESKLFLMNKIALAKGETVPAIVQFDQDSVDTERESII